MRRSLEGGLQWHLKVYKKLCTFTLQCSNERPSHWINVVFDVVVCLLEGRAKGLAGPPKLRSAGHPSFVGGVSLHSTPLHHSLDSAWPIVFVIVIKWQNDTLWLWQTTKWWQWSKTNKSWQFSKMFARTINTEDRLTMNECQLGKRSNAQHKVFELRIHIKILIFKVYV